MNSLGIPQDMLFECLTFCSMTPKGIAQISLVCKEWFLLTQERLWPFYLSQKESLYHHSSLEGREPKERAIACLNWKRGKVFISLNINSHIPDCVKMHVKKSENRIPEDCVHSIEEIRSSQTQRKSIQSALLLGDVVAITSASLFEVWECKENGAITLIHKQNLGHVCNVVQAHPLVAIGTSIVNIRECQFYLFEMEGKRGGSCYNVQSQLYKESTDLKIDAHDFFLCEDIDVGYDKITFLIQQHTEEYLVYLVWNIGKSDLLYYGQIFSGKNRQVKKGKIRLFHHFLVLSYTHEGENSSAELIVMDMARKTTTFSTSCIHEIDYLDVNALEITAYSEAGFKTSFRYLPVKEE